MVYCGKPSKGCSSCRERKIRCDQKESGCGQCEKRRQECPGYRNLVDLMFRDESSHVIKKAVKSRARGRAKKSQDDSDTIPPTPFAADPESSDPLSSTAATARRQNPSSALGLVTRSISIRDRSSRPLRWPVVAYPRDDQDDDDDSYADDDGLPSPEEGSWPTTPPTTLLYSLSPSYQERGTAYFFSRYVSVDENACHQNYDFIFDVWRPTSKVPGRQVDCVMASMTAVGLAGLSSLTRNPRMMDWSRRSYGTALRLTNDALRDPAEAVKDTTMLSILILGTYEMLTGRSPQTVRAWQEHINGASALAKMRGLAQFSTKAGARMFMMLTQIVLISCIQNSIPMPHPLVELRNQLGMLTGGRDPGWRMSGPIYKVMQLRYDIKCGNLGQTDAIIDQLSKVDREFVDIIAQLPESWHFRRLTLSQPHAAVFNGRHCHVYPALSITATWNGVRSLRMLVQETIIGELFKCFRERHILSWPYEAKLQLVKSIDLLERLRDAILASVPQHFGIVSFKDASPEHRGLPVVTTRSPPPARAVPSPSPSPSTSASSSPASPLPGPAAFNGPTLHDPTEAEGRSDGAERFMTLASANNTIVWPLYLLGVSSSCTRQVRDYVLRRLQAIHDETSLLQARGVAHMVRNKDVCVPWADLPWDQMPLLQTTADAALW